MATKQKHVTHEYAKEYKLIIRPDSDPESPREWDNVGTMVCWHRRYNLGDEQPKESPSEWIRNLAADHVKAYDAELIPDEHIQRILDKHFIILPLYLYDHSGLSMSCSAFSCPWDSGQVGYIYCTKERALAECSTIEKATEYLRNEVETYSQYLAGDVYGFELVETTVCEHCGEESEEILDSCCGFYGSDPKTNGMADHITEEYRYTLDNPEYKYDYH